MATFSRPLAHTVYPISRIMASSPCRNRRPPPLENTSLWSVLPPPPPARVTRSATLLTHRINRLKRPRNHGQNKIPDREITDPACPTASTFRRPPRHPNTPPPSSFPPFPLTSAFRHPRWLLWQSWGRIQAVSLRRVVSGDNARASPPPTCRIQEWSQVIRKQNLIQHETVLRAQDVSP